MLNVHMENVEDPKSGIDFVTEIDKKHTSEFANNPEMDDYIAKFLGLSSDAQANESQEKTMPLKEGLRTFPKAVLWSIILSTAIVMEGYDVVLLGSFYALPAFSKKYGVLSKDGTYTIEAKWQTGLSMCTNVGEIIGLFAAGIIADRIGYRWTLIGSLMLVIGFIFILFFAKDLAMLAVGEILLGMPWGAFQTLTVSYASEVCPLVLRFYLTTYVNICWILGQLIASGVLKSYAGSASKWAYKVPFALQWMWPIPIMIGIYLAPESPWWLVKKGRIDEAKVSLGRLISENENIPDKSILVDAMTAKIQLANEEEAALVAGISYFDCFKGGNWRRTRIGAMVWTLQNLTGSALMGYSTFFYEQAGLSTSNSFTFTIVQYVLGLIGTVGSWFVSRKVGRFKIYFFGLSAQTILLILVGVLGCLNSKGASWGIGTLLLVFTFTYDLTIGPVCYCLVAEIPSARLRTKSIIISRNVYNVAGIFNAVIMPYMLNTDAWNWKAKTGFFWAGFAFLGAVWCWFELPETKGRTFAELDTLFKNKVKARDFAKTEVVTFDAQEMMERLGEDGLKKMVHETEGATTSGYDKEREFSP
ncbi:hypothetical protein BABINDRAFT_162509 [Babjeviella inositovora NRRL Y-12698]|uniref:Major facilitator superfamily (MFS) profile domain-containing protein n=1 Tax=Babjeviella inositovora NRRL Y-12698 TaxID=984486 RepID=A0A1E3QMH1_9ASCO|nr:uncharacterized protein BABINDRAFT_162509 [Babjeviella inositovora NRRL Y-12698]ODQ78828.1 hypothetical protein BABINDRAFT_162509 [Babjeviella inositovora NRRL Y-12698]